MAVTPGTEPILEAAREWRLRCLLEDRSILSEASLWTLEHLEELHTHYVENPDASERKFLEKLFDQLAPASTGAKQLAAEMLWVMMLFPNNITRSTKAALVRTVWGWSGAELPADHPRLHRPFAQGVGSAGQAYNNYRWAELIFFILMTREWKRLSIDERKHLLESPWEFAAWLDEIPGADRRQFRHMLLHLLFPETFERIASGAQKRRIVERFDPELDAEVLEPEEQGDHLGAIDRRLARFRTLLAARYPDQPMDFYWEPFHEMWNPPKPEPTPASVVGPEPKSPGSDEDYEAPLLDRIGEAIRSIGLRISERTLRRYHLALQTRGFVILAGVSGTGKTWLAQAYADAVGAKCLVVPVAPNWTTNEDLLGYRNPLDGAYHHTAFSLFLKDAAAEYQRAVGEGTTPRPYHLVLDEMNLARVEYYFARFLSAMEIRARGGRAEIELGDERVPLTPNLRFIGTVNVDETTHGFADKVYDRAQLIELDAPRDILEEHLARLPYRDVVMDVWDAAHQVAPFAFRVLDEIAEYIKAAEELEVGWEELLDEQLLQKVLPKIRGTDTRLGEALERVARIAADRFPLTYTKANEMLERFRQHGFTSYF